MTQKSLVRQIETLLKGRFLLQNMYSKWVHTYTNETELRLKLATKGLRAFHYRPNFTYQSSP